MDELLEALGRPSSLAQKVWLFGIFFCTMGIILATLMVAEAVGIFFEWRALVGQAVFWAAWFSWQRWLLPLHQKSDIRADPTSAYRKGFYRDILPGVSGGMSLALVPFSYGFLAAHSIRLDPVSVISGVVCGTVAIILLLGGFKAIGFAGAGFLFEYQIVRPSLVRRGVYRYLRHPLFLGGILGGVGGSFLFAERWALALAVLNVAVLPIYAWVEDHRLLEIFGEQYSEYSSYVGAFIPKFQKNKISHSASDSSA